MTNQLSAATIAYRNFVDTCKSPATRIGYTKALKYFMGYLRMPPDGYDKLLEKDPKLIQQELRDFILYLKKDHSSATVSMYVVGLHKFFDMNHMILNWRWIRSFEGEKEKYTEDRPYTHAEIRMLVDRATSRNKAIILTMASSGVRVGALPHMRLRDLEPNDTYGIYKIIVYPKSKKSRYFTFCTPECRAAIDTYLDWRKRFGERLEPDSPLFRCSFNAEGVNVRNPHAITRSVIIKAITQLLKHCGIRPHLTLESESRKHHRYDIMGSHGLRKFWETQAYRAGMDVQYMRRLLGQKGGNHVLEDAYLKLEDNELLEGDSKHVGYIGIIDQLTISEENKLKRKVETLTLEISKYDGILNRLGEIEKQIGL